MVRSEYFIIKCVYSSMCLSVCIQKYVGGIVSVYTHYIFVHMVACICVFCASLKMAAKSLQPSMLQGLSFQRPAPQLDLSMLSPCPVARDGNELLLCDETLSPLPQQPQRRKLVVLGNGPRVGANLRLGEGASNSSPLLCVCVV